MPGKIGLCRCAFECWPASSHTCKTRACAESSQEPVVEHAKIERCSIKYQTHCFALC